MAKKKKHRIEKEDIEITDTDHLEGAEIIDIESSEDPVVGQCISITSLTDNGGEITESAEPLRSSDVLAALGSAIVSILVRLHGEHPTSDITMITERICNCIKEDVRERTQTEQKNLGLDDPELRKPLTEEQRAALNLTLQSPGFKPVKNN